MGVREYAANILLWSVVLHVCTGVCAGACVCVWGGGGALNVIHVKLRKGGGCFGTVLLHLFFFLINILLFVFYPFLLTNHNATLTDRQKPSDQILHSRGVLLSVIYLCLFDTLTVQTTSKRRIQMQNYFKTSSLKHAPVIAGFLKSHTACCCCCC